MCFEAGGETPEGGGGAVKHGVLLGGICGAIVIECRAKLVPGGARRGTMAGEKRGSAINRGAEALREGPEQEFAAEG